ncbi:MAG: DUF1963 domain-containing protein [Thermoguttaceae bacterium]|jgi:hypothetical protein
MQNTHHEVVDIERWIELYPLETFENEETEAPPICPPEANDEQKRAWQYLYGDSQCLEKAEGQIIVSPADLAMIEQVRRRASQTHSLGKAVPTDIFLLGVGEPEAPCLTKVGGIPYRPADKPWPRANDGTPLSFFLQFCFLDSKDLVPSNLPGDVMLLFVRNWDSLTKPAETDSYRIEWSRIPLHNPVAAGQCPEQPIAAPKYYGAIYRTNEYPESEGVFEQEGHESYWLFAKTQATRIGGDTWFIQYDHDPRQQGETLLCTFNCVYLKGRAGSEVRFPFVNVDSSRRLSKEQISTMRIILGDCGCLYFLVDEQGNVRWEHQCY